MTVDAQNRPKPGGCCSYWSLVPTFSAQSDSAYSKRLKLTDSQWHVTADAQNRPKIGRRP